MAFTKITAAGIGSTETVTLDGLSVINNGSFGGNLTVGGDLTYEDVTNVDSVGLITARNGIVVGSGITLSKDGDGFFTGVVTATSYAGDGSGLTGIAATDNVRTGILDVAGVGTFRNDVNIADKIIHTGDTNTAIRFPAADTFTVETAGSERVRVTSTGGIHFNNAELIERVSIVGNKLSAAPNVNLDNGMVHYYTTNETATATPNIISTAGINTNMATGDTMSVTILSKPNNAGYFPKVSIDGVATGITTYWSGGSAPSSAESSGVDVNVYQIIKTADATYDVLANTSNFA